MKVTIIYDEICLDCINHINVQIVIINKEFRYFVQNTQNDVNYRYRRFDCMTDVVDFANSKEEQCLNAKAEDFKYNYAFRYEEDFCSWLNSICNNEELVEIFNY